MILTDISVTRVLSDRQYGNHQATISGYLDEGEDPAECLRKLNELAEAAVQEANRKAIEAEEAERRAVWAKQRQCYADLVQSGTEIDAEAELKKCLDTINPEDPDDDSEDLDEEETEGLPPEAFQETEF